MRYLDVKVKIDNTVTTFKFSAEHVSSQLFPDGRSLLHFVGGSHEGRKIQTAQFMTTEVILCYLEPEK